MKKTFACIGLGLLLAFAPNVFSANRGRPGNPPPGRRDGGPPQGNRGGRNETAVPGTAVQVFKGKQSALPELSVQSAKADESALRVQDGARLSIGRLTVGKRGNASSEEDSNFYSLNAAVAVWKGSSLAVNGGLVETNGDGANAFVAYGTNAAITVRNLEIRTSANSSRGLHATYGGRIEGENLKITTKGAHCAALATDRGGGTVVGKRIRSVTNGDGSPGIYSTGNITAIDSSFESYGAEAAVIEGRNTITVRNCRMVGRRRCGVMLYQSFSGDAEAGTSVFTMEGGSLTAQSGPVFYVTNTSAKAVLSNATLVSGNGVLIEAGSNRWGRSGQNGGHLNVQASSQTLNGDVAVNDISDVTLSLGRRTRLNGAVNAKATAGKVNVELAEDAVWNVTADSSVDLLSSADGTWEDLRAKIVSNGHVIHYRVKRGFLNGGKFPLEHGGMLVYTPAPKAKVQTSNDNNDNQDMRERGGNGRPALRRGASVNDAR